MNGLLVHNSSMLKSHYGKWGTKLIELGRGLDWKLAMTGTPAPNDRIEYANHAVLLDAFPTVNSFLATYFVNRGETGERWELKPHALGSFYRALSHWCVFLSDPSVYGWRDNVGTLPPIQVHVHDVEMGEALSARAREATGKLFVDGAGGIVSRGKLARMAREDGSPKPAFVRSLVDSWQAEESTLIWCRFNDEQDKLASLFPEAGSIDGRTPEAERSRLIRAFQSGAIRTLITKTAVLGFGLNLQVATRQVFSGIDDCYDQETEILTRDGWKGFGEVAVGQDVATVNPESQAFEWQAAERVIWGQYQGPMYHFVGQRNFDLLVTPNHKLYVQRCPVRYATSDGQFSLIRAGDIAGRFRKQEYRMRSASDGFVSEVPEAIPIPPRGNRQHWSNSRNIESVETEDMIRLAGWYVSEGYCRPEGTQEFGRIVLCQTDKHPDHREEIIALLGRLGLNVNAKTKDITSYSQNLAAFLIDQFGGSSATMRLPAWIKNLDGRLLVILRDTMLKGDGCHSAEGIARAYRTISTRLADDFQEICLKTGVRASVHHRLVGGHPTVDVSLAWQNVRPMITLPPEVVHYSGMIGCVTVPNHVVIVRRNGIPVVSGNSYESFHQAVKRSNRVGSTKPLNVHVPVTDLERPMLENVLRKARQVERDTRETERIFRDAGFEYLFG